MNKILALIYYLVIVVLFLVAIVYLFIDWHIGLYILGVILLLRAIAMGPHVLFTVLIGFLAISSIVALFINWKISIFIFALTYAVTRFYNWSKKVNYEYYSKRT